MHSGRPRTYGNQRNKNSLVEQETLLLPISGNLENGNNLVEQETLLLPVAPTKNSRGEDWQFRETPPANLRPSGHFPRKEDPFGIRTTQARLLALNAQWYENVEERLKVVDLETLLLPAVPTKKSKGKKWLSFVIRTVLTVLICGILFRSISWPTLLGALGNLNQSILLVSLEVGAGGIVLSAYQWRSLLLSEKIHIDLARLINLYMVGIAFSHFLPTGMGGDAVKALYVGRESNNRAGSASAVVLSRVTGFIGMLLLGWPVALIWHDQFAKGVLLSFATLSSLVGGMIFVALMAVIFLSRFLHGKLGKVRFIGSALQIGKVLFTALKRPRFLFLAILYGLVFQFSAVLNCYAYGVALGIQAPLCFYCVAVPLIALVAFLPVSINGYGLRESTYVYVFSTVHVQTPVALLLALLLDAQTLLFGLLGGLIYFNISNKTKPSNKSGFI